MDDSEFQRMPNPFSPFAQDQADRRRNLFGTFKLLFAAIALFALATASQAYLHRARLASLIGDFAQGSTAEKFDRLEQLHASGRDGIAGLVAAVGDPNEDVSAKAAGILIETGQRWSTLPLEQQRSHQVVFAESLLRLVDELDAIDDPRFTRAQSLAQHAVSQWLVPAQGSGLKTDEQHGAICAMLAKVLNCGQESTTAAQSPMVADDPLPIELAGSQAASWTDWPPTPLAPQLYRRPVATLDVPDQPAVVLSQLAEPTSPDSVEAAIADSDPLEPRIVKPSYQPTTSLNEQPMRVPGGTTATLSYWARQLESPSRNVRLRAVTELSRRGDAQCLEALRNHLSNEPDHGVAFRIRQVLDESSLPD